MGSDAKYLKKEREKIKAREEERARDKFFFLQMSSKITRGQ